MPRATDATAPALAGAIESGKYVKHVVIVVQENRSFENMFAGWPGADAPLSGLATQKDGTVTRVPLTKLRYEDEHDICHFWADAIKAWDGGKMDAFNLEHDGFGPSCSQKPVGTYAYSYMDPREIKPYHDLARRYVLADRMFPTEFGTSFTAHQDLIAGTTEVAPGHSLVNIPSNYPWGCDAPAGTYSQLVDSQRVVRNDFKLFPCFDQYPTIADRLDAANVSWRYYVPKIHTLAGQVWNPFDAVKSIRYSSSWKNVVNPDTKVLTAISNGELPSVSWVVPELDWADYPASQSDKGPSWVASIVNAVGRSKYWNSTAIVVLWDDWGGWYDNARPPQKDYAGLAIRVPCIIISPYARHGYVSHTVYEYGSILRFIEQVFNLPTLDATDKRANSLIDSFDFKQRPSPYVPVETKYSPAFFLRQPPSNEPPDND